VLLSKDEELREELRRELDEAIERARKGQRRKLQQPEGKPPTDGVSPVRADQLRGPNSEG
jgi:hypothetical protein